MRFPAIGGTSVADARYGSSSGKETTTTLARDDRRQEVYLVARGRERLEAVEAALRACVLTDTEFAAYTQALVGYRDVAQCVACSPGASAAAPKPVVRSKFF